MQGRENQALNDERAAEDALPRFLTGQHLKLTQTPKMYQNDDETEMLGISMQ